MATVSDIQGRMSVGGNSSAVEEKAKSIVTSVSLSIGKTRADFNPTQGEIEEHVKFLRRGHEAGLINDTTQSSVVIRHNGQINVSSSRYSQYKLNPSGKVIEEALESVALSNRRKVITDDMIINEHKLNPYLYELTDMKKLTTAQSNNMIVGNICMFGSVLTKTWDMNLKRYVLVRRPMRIPLFSPALNVPEINVGIGVTDPLKIDETLLAKSTKGYQVNQPATDAKSLVGQIEGVNRAGTGSQLIAYGGNGSGSGTAVDVNTSAIGGYDTKTDTYNFGIERNENKLFNTNHSMDEDVFKMPDLSISYGGKDRWVRIAYMVSAYCSKSYKGYSGWNLPPAYVFAQMWKEMGPLSENGICGGNNIQEISSVYLEGMRNRNFSGLHGSASSASYASDNDYAKDYAYGFLIKRGPELSAHVGSPEQYVQAMKDSGYFESSAADYLSGFKTGLAIFNERVASNS